MVIAESNASRFLNLRETLKERGYSLNWLAEGMGLTKRVVNHIANSGRVRQSEALRIGKLLGIDYDVVWSVLSESGRRPGIQRRGPRGPRAN